MCGVFPLLQNTVSVHMDPVLFVYAFTLFTALIEELCDI